VPNWYILAFAAFLAVFGLFVLRRAVRLRGVIRRLKELEPVSVVDATVGLVMVRGRLATDEPLMAPLSGRPAVYYFLRFETVPEPGKKPRRLAVLKQWTATRLEDATGSLRLEPWTPLVASAHDATRRFEGLERIPEVDEELFEAAGITQRHLASIQPFVATEYRFEPGDEAYVTGIHEPGKGIYRTKGHPFVVSATRDLGYVQGLRNELALYFSVPFLLFSAAAVVAILAFA
jgi:hypothetical protein